MDEPSTHGDRGRLDALSGAELEVLHLRSSSSRLARCASLVVQHHTAAAAAISARSVDAPFLDEKERKEAREQNYNGEEMDDADDVVGFLRRTPPSGGGRTGGRL